VVSIQIVPPFAVVAVPMAVRSVPGVAVSAFELTTIVPPGHPTPADTGALMRTTKEVPSSATAPRTAPPHHRLDTVPPPTLTRETAATGHQAPRPLPGSIG